MTFSPAQLRRLLAGHDVLTILPIEPQPHHFVWKFEQRKDGTWQGYERDSDRNMTRGLPIPCPYPVGTVVPVREEWAINGTGEGGTLSNYTYDIDILYSDNVEACWQVPRSEYEIYDEMFSREDGDEAVMRPANTMPDWAIRLHAIVTAVTAKRACEATEEAMATGINPQAWCWFIVWKGVRG